MQCTREWAASGEELSAELAGSVAGGVGECFSSSNRAVSRSDEVAGAWGDVDDGAASKSNKVAGR